MPSSFQAFARSLWPKSRRVLDLKVPINSLEAKALVRSLLAFRDHVCNSRVDIHTDNRTIKAGQFWLQEFIC